MKKAAKKVAEKKAVAATQPSAARSAKPAGTMARASQIKAAHKSCEQAEKGATSLAMALDKFRAETKHGAVSPKTTKAVAKLRERIAKFTAQLDALDSAPTA